MNVHQPADVFVHAPTNELYVADGYGNQRVAVFDAGQRQVQAHVGRVRQDAAGGDGAATRRRPRRIRAAADGAASSSGSCTP